MKRIKKILSAFLCLCLIFGLIIPAAAEELSSVGSGSDAAVTGAEPELADTGTTYTMNVGQTKWIFLNFNEPRSALNSAVWESNCPWEVEILEQESIGCQIRINEYISYTAIISCTYYYTQYDRDYKYHHFLKGYESYYIKVNEPEKYTLSFDPAGGSVSASSTTVYSGSAWGSLPTPHRSGYIFQGWYTSGGDRVTSNTIATRSMTVYARWLEDVVYTVKFNANGGTVSTASSAVHNGSSIGTLPEPTRSGYAFDGWYTAASGGNRVYSSTTVTSDMTLYAHWADAVRITFDPTGGTVSPKYADIKKGASIDSLPTPTKENYYFNGWYTAASGGTKVTSSTTFSAKTTIYAHWIPGIIIYFRPEGGKVSPETMVIKPGGSIGTLPEPKRSGYAFDGWYTAASGGDRVYSDTEFEFNTKIYAHWKEYIKLTLDPNGGTVSEKSVTMISGKEAGSLPNAERDGYYFIGWYTAADGGSEVTASTVFTKSTKLYAHWDKGVNITLSPMGGTVSQTRLNIRTGDSIGYLPSAKRNGYSFSGWVARDSDAYATSSDVFYQDTVLYAVWTKYTDDFTFIIDRNKATLKLYEGSAIDVVIPSEIDGYKVTKIGDHAFDNTKVWYVTVPEGVTEIGERAFSNCINLTRVVLPNSLRYIEECAFIQNFVRYRPLENINIPAGIEYVGVYAFTGTKWYENRPNGPIYIGKALYEYKGGAPANISLKGDTTCISGRAFYENTGLKSISIPASVKYIGKSAFDGCKNLTSVNLPKGLSTISDRAFSNCTSLTSVTLPDGITGIEEYAFHACNKLSSINIPGSVTHIESQSFYGCTSLKSITIPESVDYIAYRSLGYYVSNGTSVTLDGFTIRGYEDTAAHSYANSHGFKFEVIGLIANKIPMGDLNGDGQVNNRDAMLLDRYISDWPGYESKVKGNRLADISNDGAVTNRDVIILDRYVAGWDGYGKYICKVTYVGDLNNDGSANNRDAIIFDRYIAGWDGYKAMLKNKDAADLNRDKSINNRDAMMLDRYIAGWAGYDKYIVTV